MVAAQRAPDPGFSPCRCTHSPVPKPTHTRLRSCPPGEQRPGAGDGGPRQPQNVAEKPTPLLSPAGPAGAALHGQRQHGAPLRRPRSPTLNRLLPRPPKSLRLRSGENRRRPTGLWEENNVAGGTGHAVQSALRLPSLSPCKRKGPGSQASKTCLQDKSLGDARAGQLRYGGRFASTDVGKRGQLTTRPHRRARPASGHRPAFLPKQQTLMIQNEIQRVRRKNKLNIH